MVKSSALILVFVWALPAFALNLSTDDEPARQAALQWLQVIDSENYKDAALMLSNYVRASRDWPNYLATQRAPLGRTKDRQITSVRHAAIVADDPETRQHAILRFKTWFEKIRAMEEIVLAKTGCCWEVCDYKILPAQKD